MKTLICGGAGQDGVLLGRHLQSMGHDVYSLVRPDRSRATHLASLLPRAHVIEGDVTDISTLEHILESVRPDHIYNLAAISSVAKSWQHPAEVMRVNAIGTVNVLEAIRTTRLLGTTRLYQASSSEMFGMPADVPQTEATPFAPRSPYAAAKTAAHQMVANYRESFGLFACSGILYNHESHLRPPTFVTRKITSGVAAIAKGHATELVLGDINISRDWGYAGDYVKAMSAMLERDEPRDYVVATGRSHTLREFLSVAFGAVGIADWVPLVRSDPALRRPLEVGRLVGDATRAREQLSWAPTTSFERMIRMMVDHDMRLLQDRR